MKTILHLCADVGSDSKPYRDGGYNVICVGSDVGVENYHPPEDVYGIIANPPCTHFSIARSRAATPRDLREGMRLVKECLRIIWEAQYDIEEGKRHTKLKFWCIENPATGMLPLGIRRRLHQENGIVGEVQPSPEAIFLGQPINRQKPCGGCNEPRQLSPNKK